MSCTAGAACSRCVGGLETSFMPKLLHLHPLPPLTSPSHPHCPPHHHLHHHLCATPWFLPSLSPIGSDHWPPPPPPADRLGRGGAGRAALPYCTTAQVRWLPRRATFLVTCPLPPTRETCSSWSPHSCKHSTASTGLQGPLNGKVPLAPMPGC